MEIFKNFGLDPLLLLAQIVNFLILLYLLNKFFFKKVLNFLREREQKISAGLEAAKKGEELLEKAKISQKEILHQAREEGDKFLKAAQRTSVELSQDLQLKARKETDRILQEAKLQAVNEAEQIKKALEKKIVGIAISIVERTMARLMTTEEHKKIINTLAKDVKAPI